MVVLTEGMCMRAGKLSRRICHDNARVIRMMETYDMDRIIAETPAWWNMALTWSGSGENLCSDFGIGKRFRENIFTRTSSQGRNIGLCSHIKMQRTGLKSKLLLWKQKDILGGSYLAGQSRGSRGQMKETMEMAGEREDC